MSRQNYAVGPPVNPPPPPRCPGLRILMFFVFDFFTLVHSCELYFVLLVSPPSWVLTKQSPQYHLLLARWSCYYLQSIFLCPCDFYFPCVWPFTWIGVFVLILICGIKDFDFSVESYHYSQFLVFSDEATF